MNRSLATVHPASNPTNRTLRAPRPRRSRLNRTPHSFTRKSPGSVPTTTPNGPRCSARTAAQRSSAEGASPGRCGTPRPPPVFTSTIGTADVDQRAHHRRHPPDALLEHRELLVQVAVADVDVQGVDREIVLVRDGDRVVELFGEDAELRWSRTGVQRLAGPAPRRADPGVHAHAQRRPRRRPAHARRAGSGDRR